MKKILSILLLTLGTIVIGQQPQTTTAPVSAINAKYVNGVAPGYRPTPGTGLTLNIGGGTSFCSGSVVQYSGGSLTMTSNTTNNVYLNTSSSCAPSTKTTQLNAADIPIAIVTTSGGTITSITDVRLSAVTPAQGTATVLVGTTSTGAAGTNAAVTNSGSSSAAVLNFVIPQGQTGQTGPQGIQGAQGTNGSATVAIGTTSTGAPGTSSSVTNTGSNNAAVLNFVIPQGQTGQQGNIGNTGPQGVQGVSGPTVVTFKGTWSSSATYAAGDEVTYNDGTNNLTYVSAVSSNTNSTPAQGGTSAWTQIAASAGIQVPNVGQIAALAIANNFPATSGQLLDINKLSPPTYYIRYDGTYQQNTSGGDSNQWFALPYFPLQPGTWTANFDFADHPWYYRADGSIIGQATESSNNGGTVFTAPAGTAYGRSWIYTCVGQGSCGQQGLFTVGVSGGATLAVINAGGHTYIPVASATIVQGSTLPSTVPVFPFENMATVPFVTTTAQQPAAAYAQAMGGINLFNPATVTNNEVYLLNNGSWTVSPFGGFFVSDYIPVAGLSSIYVSFVRGEFLSLDKTTQLASSGGYAGAITPPAGAAWFRFSGTLPAQTTGNFVYAGTAAPALYRTYGGVDAIEQEIYATAGPYTSPWSNQTLGLIGDSFCAAFHDNWVPNIINANHFLVGSIDGNNLPIPTYMDCHSGRSTSQIFSAYGQGSSSNGTMFGDPTQVGNGGTNGVQSTDPASTNYSNTTMTLAQELANIDVLLVESGPNDGLSNGAVGLITDMCGTPNSYMAIMRCAIEGIQKAKPSIRLIWIGTYHYDGCNGHFGNTEPNQQAVNAAQKLVTAEYGVPWLDSFHNSGIGPMSWYSTPFALPETQTQTCPNFTTGYSAGDTLDGGHPSATGGAKWGNWIGNAIKGLF